MNMRGQSQMDLLIALVIAGVAVMGVAAVWVALHSGLVSAYKRVDSLESLALIKLQLGHSVGGGRLRTYFFTGNAPEPAGLSCGSCSPTGNDRVFGRLIIPMPDLCRDLQTSCPNSVTMLMADSQKATGSQLALCFFNDSILVQNPAVGGPILSILSPPSSSLWVLNGAATSVSVDPTTGAPLPADCVANLRRVNNGIIPGGTYYTVPVRPLTGLGVTGGGCVCDDQKATAVSEYPARLMTTRLLSVGTMPENDAYNWGYGACTADASGQSLTCDSQSDVVVHGVAGVEIQESFTTKDQTSGVDWYILNANADPTSCTSGVCAKMPVSLPLRSALLSESTSAINYTQFSLIKQDLLSSIRVQLRKKDGQIITSQFSF